MTGPLLLRGLLALAVPVFVLLRLRTAQRQPFPEQDLNVGQLLGLALSLLADLMGLVLAVAFILNRSLPAWGSEPGLPLWSRWLGAAVLLASLFLLAWANRQLPEGGERDGSVDASRLPESGPYRWIRHPVYLSILSAYLGAGVMSSDLALAFVPALLHLGARVRDVAREENLLRDYQGHQQANQLQRTGMFFPPWHRMTELGSEADGGSDRSNRGREQPESADESNQT